MTAMAYGSEKIVVPTENIIRAFNFLYLQASFLNGQSSYL